MKDLSSKLSSVIFDYLCSFTELIHELKIDDHDVDASPAYSQGKYNSTKYQCFPGFLTILILHEIYQNQMEIRKNGIYRYIMVIIRPLLPKKGCIYMYMLRMLFLHTKKTMK